MIFRHYVRVTAALAATGGTSSIFTGSPPTGPLPTGPLVAITAADAASRPAAMAAAALWNGSYPSGAPLAPATVTTSVVATFGPDSTTVGLASGTLCDPAADPRHLCGAVTLQVKAGWEALFVDIFVHEIGHAVIYRGATAPPDRVLDSGHHWSPFEASELFGPSISFQPWLAAYTVAAAGGGAACSGACDGVCTAVADFRRVPGVCAAGAPRPAGSAGSGGTAAGSAGSGGTAAAIGGGVGGAVLLVGVAACASRRSAATDSREPLII
jgi:hypothetical protein